jgi:uncharacterized membrane protein (UPF0127 family)
VDKAQATKLALLALLALALLLGGNFFMTGSQGPEALLVTFPSGTQLHGEVADTPLILHSGLAFRDSLPTDWGLLLIYEVADFHKVNTKQYRFPVDFLWLDEGKRVLLIVEDAKPCSSSECPSYGPPPEKARYVIITNAGFARQEGLVPGANLRFSMQL